MMTDTETITNPFDLIYTPAETVTIGTKYLQYRREHKDFGIPLGLKSLDDIMLPVVPGEMITIVGRPGCGKTGFMMRWARYRAEWLKMHGEENKVVVYASWEQSIEELYAFNVAADTRISVTDMARGEITDDEWEAALTAGAWRMSLPLWFIGHSLERRRKRPRLTITALAESLTAIDHWEDEERTQIDMIFVDYLQRIPFDGKVESKTIGTSEVLDRLKDGALAFGCPMVVGVQATRDVDNRELAIPRMDDGQWTSNIEQASDKILSVVRPRKYRKEGEHFGSVIVQGHCQMLVSILKQKMGADNISKWVYFDPMYNKLDELEMRGGDLNDERWQE